MAITVAIAGPYWSIRVRTRKWPVRPAGTELQNSKAPRSLRRALILALTVGLLAGAGAASNDKASERLGAVAPDSWPLVRGDLSMSGVAASELAFDLKVKWTKDLAADIEGSAIIDDGVVYIGDYDGYLWALSLDDGRELWKYNAQNPIKATPSIFEGVVYVGDEYGFLHAVDAATGNQLWTFETMAEILSSATFYDDRLLIGSYDNSLYSLERNDGSLAWKVETDGYVHAVPAIVGRTTTVSGCDGYLWLINIDDGSTIAKVDLGGQAPSSPAIRDGVAYVGTYENEVLAVDLDKHRVLWRYEHPERKFPYYASAAVTEEYAVIGGRDKMIHLLDRETGKARWTWNSGARIDSSPVVVGDRIFAGSKTGEVFALDAATGEPVWKFETGSAIVSSPAVAAKKLVIASLDGVVYCFE